MRRRPGVPRVLLEVLFLAGGATAAALAELDAPVIAAVMAAAWVLVALIEWAASRAERRREAYPLPAPVPLSAPEPLPADPSWFVPPVEQTLRRACGRLPDGGHEAASRQPDLDATDDRPPSA